MPGWMAQNTWKIPAWSKVKPNAWPVPNEPESQEPDDVVVCVPLVTVQMMRSPLSTDNALGTKAKLSIPTDQILGPAVVGGTVVEVVLVDVRVVVVWAVVDVVEVEVEEVLDVLEEVGGGVAGFVVSAAVDTGGGAVEPVVVLVAVAEGASVVDSIVVPEPVTPQETIRTVNTATPSRCVERAVGIGHIPSLRIRAEIGSTLRSQDRDGGFCRWRGGGHPSRRRRRRDLSTAIRRRSPHR